MSESKVLTKDVEKFEDRAVVGSVVPAQKSSSQALVEMAMRTGDLDKLQKAMELQERWEANEARKSYHEAMAAFKADPPKISKDKHVQYDTSKGNTSYNHASLANVCASINKALSTHGLSAAWQTTQESGVTVTCTITHRGGHSESTSLTAAPDTSGSKNSIQALGSAITYLQRYTLLALTGLAAHDQDDDGQGAGKPVEFITTDQQTEILDMLKETDSSVDKFLKYMGVSAVDEISVKKYPAAVAALKAKGGKK